ncbi:MAG: beta-lactamase family protein [Rhodospirillales bacterium]|nr:beta-lactamase family protein [Rhodospirillales bacterium]
MTEGLGAALAAAPVPGICGLVARRDGVLWQGAAGTASVQSRAFLASMSKAVTSVAALVLVQQGRLALDEPVGRWVDELAAPQVLEGFDTAGEPRLRAARVPITLRHLLTHTAGFGYPFFNEKLLHFSRLRPPRRPVALFDAGTQWEYGINTDWVAKAVASAAGLAFEDVVRQTVLEPLGMSSTGYAFPDDRLAVHARQDDGSLAAVDHQPPRNREFFQGGAGLCGSAPDYARFLRMLLGGGELEKTRVLQPEMVELLFTDQLPTIRPGLVAGPMRPVQPEITLATEIFPGMPAGWSLAGAINPAPLPTGRAAGSLSWAGIANTYFWADRSRDLAGVLLMQFYPFGDPVALATLTAFETAAYAALG